MKLTNTQNMKRKAGMTLIELTVVILVLLSLIAILFVGASAWKKGSDRAACIMNIRNVQQAVRGHQNMSNAAVGDAITSTAIIGANGYIQTTPSCPASGSYTLAGTYPALGTLAYTCSKSTDLQHAPNDTTGW
jgi:prepilin-type N-terminal cleavage/methylation domain-containing protein